MQMQVSCICSCIWTRVRIRSNDVARFLRLILLSCFLGLATGSLQYLHESQDFAEDAKAAALEKAAGPFKPHLPHDEGNCQICSTLHMALSSPGWVPLLICLGLFVAFLTLLPVSLPLQATLVRIDCRGPPAC